MGDIVHGECPVSRDQKISFPDQGLDMFPVGAQFTREMVSGQVFG